MLSIKRTEQPAALASPKLISGWGRYPLISAQVYNPDTMRLLNACLTECSELDMPVIARGMGRSYGDPAVAADARVVQTLGLNRMLEFDESSGRLRCEPGVSFEDIINTFLPRGWFPPVTPGTKYVTMGGALASDIHGKNHHKDGSFANFVNSFLLVTADNTTLRCSREENSDLFWATAGGMGLTGFIKEIELDLKSVETPYLHVKKIRCSNLDETCRLIEESEKEYEYSVCWIDCLASAANLGRSILILGRHASKNDLSDELKNAELVPVKKGITVPLDMPSWLLNRFSIGAFNEVYYHFSSASAKEHIEHYNPFFYPLDFLSDWNRMYGKDGFIQYQCVFPLKQSRVGLEEVLDLSARRGRSSFLAVLKKFGKGNRFLSFPTPGYTLTLDIPVKAGLIEFTKELDAIVLKYGGRVYLAKDACLDADAFRKMYPEFPAWQEIKRSVDPSNHFRSSLSERLKLQA